MHERLSRALAPVLADVLATTELRLRVEEADWSDVPGQETAMLRLPDGSGAGASVLLTDDDVTQLAVVADRAQEVVVENIGALG